jgi:hypothetical protein
MKRTRGKMPLVDRLIAMFASDEFFYLMIIWAMLILVFNVSRCIYSN